MLQSVFRGFQKVVSANHKPILFRQCSSTEQSVAANQTVATKPAKKSILDIHKVRISGRVHSIFKHEHNVTFYIKSVDGDFRKTHKAVISTRNQSLFTSATERLAKNQYVCIEGKLNSEQIKSDDGRIRNLLTVVVADLIMSESSEYLTSDMNEVELMGRVTTDVIMNPNYRAFTLSVVKKPGTADSKPVYNYNKIFVYDKEWFPVVDGIKNRMKNVLIRGQLTYSGFKLPSGKNAAAGIIVANQIYKKKE